MNLDAYRKTLRGLIAKRDRGLLLDARLDRDASGEIKSTPEAYFRISSRTSAEIPMLARTFVTVWGISRSEADLHECLEALASCFDKIVHDMGSIDYLVTCTPTGKFLMEYLHTRLQTDRAALKHVYLGPSPAAIDPQASLAAGLRALVITDVVASGRTLRSVVGQLTKRGVQVCAALTVVSSTDAKASVEEINVDDGLPLPLYSLTDFDIEVVDDTSADPRHAIELTPGEILRRLIADTESKMLLGPGPEVDVYRRPSGGYQRHFVTLWPLFKNPIYFEELMDQLAEKARTIRRNSSGGTYYSAIVTCTATGRHLMEHLQPRIEAVDGPVDAYYFGPFPYQAATRYGDGALKDKSVLVLADVVASQTLVKNIATIVHRLGGTVAAVLGVVHLRLDHSDPDLTIRYAHNATTRIEYLTEYPVDEVSKEDVAAWRNVKIADIDPKLIVPKPSPVADRSSRQTAKKKQPPNTGESANRPMFSIGTMLMHLDQADALQMGLFEANRRHFTAGVHLPRLLCKFGQKIWKKMACHLEKCDLLVTTTERDDLCFLDFVQRWSSATNPPLKSLLVPRLDSVDFDFPDVLPDEERKDLNKKRIALLLNSAQNSDKLHSLISLLAQSQIVSLTVICVFNRLGNHTADFINRIETLTSGIGSKRRSGNFDFHWVYSIDDLHGADLVTTVESIHRLAEQYSAQTHSPVFKSMMEEELRYFRLRPFADRMLADNAHQPLRPLATTGQMSNLKSIDAKIYKSYVATRGISARHAKLVSLLVAEEDRGRRYLILVLLLSDISYLRMTKQTAQLKRTIVATAYKRRQDRFDIERHLPGHSVSTAQEAVFVEITRLVLEETTLIFSLALLSYLDDGEDDYLPWVEGFSKGGLHVQGWMSYPLNFQAYYGSSRCLWCVSLLLFCAHLEKSMPPRKFNAQCEKLVGLCRDHQSRVANGQISLVAVDEQNEGSWRRRLEYSFDSLLMDLGVHNLNRRDNVLLFLNNRVGLKAHHNAMAKDIQEAITKLSNCLRTEQRKLGGMALSNTRGVVLPQEDLKQLATAAASETEVSATSDLPNNTRIWKSAVDKGIQAAAMLNLVGEAAADLFQWYRFTNVSKEEASRYLAPASQNGLRGNVESIRARLSRIRASGVASWQDVTDISSAYKLVASDIVVTNRKKSDSALRRALDDYLPSLIEIAIEELESADRFLSQDYGIVWQSQIEVLRRIMAKYPVICDPVLLKEALWNVFTNVRYGLPIAGLNQANPASESLEIRLTHEAPSVGQKRAMVQIEVLSPRPDQTRNVARTDTIFRQRQEIEEYGGKLDVTYGELVRVVLQLESVDQGGTT